jgi:hypothetical protein
MGGNFPTGLMPTTEFKLAGHRIKPSPLVPSDTATMFAATDIDGPLLDPQGSSNGIRLPCGSLKLLHGCCSGKRYRFPLKKFVKFLINLKIIKIIIIKNKKY